MLKSCISLTRLVGRGGVLVCLASKAILIPFRLVDLKKSRTDWIFESVNLSLAGVCTCRMSVSRVLQIAIISLRILYDSSSGSSLSLCVKSLWHRTVNSKSFCTLLRHDSTSLRLGIV